MRSVSSTPSSSSWNGSGVERLRISRASTCTSISPVAMPGLTVSGVRLTTVPCAWITNSLRSSCAVPAASGAFSGLITSWRTPPSSRRSTKIRPPWSRRRATQPASVTARPSSSGRSELPWMSRQTGLMSQPSVGRSRAERSEQIVESDDLLGLAAATDGGVPCADHDDRARARTPRLRHLALDAAACVVRVACEPGATQLAHRLQDALARRHVLEDEEDVDALGLRGDPLFFELDQQPLDACAEADPR